jgi:hypothetical protein
VSKPNRIDRLREASKGTESKPVVVKTEFSSVPQATIEASAESNRANIAPVRCDVGELVPCGVVMNGAESVAASKTEGGGVALDNDEYPTMSRCKDGRMLNQAIQRWPLDPDKKAALMAKVMGMALETSVPRELAALTRAVLSADAINLAEEKHANPNAQVQVHVNISADDRLREIKSLVGESVTRRLGVDDTSG